MVVVIDMNSLTTTTTADRQQIDRQNISAACRRRVPPMCAGQNFPAIIPPFHDGSLVPSSDGDEDAAVVVVVVVMVVVVVVVVVQTNTHKTRGGISPPTLPCSSSSSSFFSSFIFFSSTILRFRFPQTSSSATALAARKPASQLEKKAG
jgi:hypothetical protein